MPYQSDLSNVRIPIDVAGCRIEYRGGDWLYQDKIDKDGVVTLSSGAKDANGNDITVKRQASGLYIIMLIAVVDAQTGEGCSGDSLQFNTLTGDGGPSNFFNYYVVEFADAGAALKSGVSFGATELNLYNSYQSGAGPLNVVSQENLSWYSIDADHQPKSLVFNTAGGIGSADFYGVDAYKVAQPIEHEGTNGEKKWFTWTAFRVRPRILGRNSYVQPNVVYDTTGPEPETQYWGWYLQEITEGQYKAWDGAAVNTATDYQPPAADTNADPETELVDTFVDMSKLLTNLPMTKYARRNNDGSRGPKWRDGMLHTWENTPATEGLKSGIPYGFKFHWNPAGWSQSASMTESINPEQFAASNPQQVPLLGGFSSISVTIQLNRMFDLQGNSNERNNGDLNPTDELRISRRASELLALGEYNYNGSGYGVPKGFEGYIGTQDKYTDIKNLLRQGTLYDLDYLFAVTNGTTYGSYHVNYTPKTGGGDLINPSYKMTDSSSSRAADRGIPVKGFIGGSPDYGFISAKPVRIWLGPHITFVGRIQSYSIQHLLFTEYMIPTVTQVSLSLTRSVTMGSTFDESVKLANDQTATSNADTTSTGDPNATDPED